MTRPSRQVALAAALALAACGSSKEAVPEGGSGPGPASVRGGKGTGGAVAASGGAGGTVRFASQGGDVRVTTTPDLEGRPAFPPPAPPALGANPRTVSGAGTVAPAADEVLLGDDGVSPATGLWVKAGAVATLVPNAGSADDRTTSILLAGPVVIDGTLRPGARDGLASPSRAHFYAEATALRVGPAGLVDAGGLDVPAGGGPGGDGGRFVMNVVGEVVVEGRIDTSGGDGDDGGDGATLSVANASGWVALTGSTDASGGGGRVGAGGDAGTNELWGDYGFEDHAGNGWFVGPMLARGGKGATDGGDGGQIYVAPGRSGWTVVRATLDASGGESTAAGGGGDGGAVKVDGDGGFWIEGTLSAAGADGRGGGPGGHGGLVHVLGLAPASPPSLPNSGHLAATVDASGGDGATGGQGGTYRVDLLRNAAAASLPLLVAHSSVDASGGDGAAGGGSGGLVEAQSAPGAETGDATLATPVSATGGAGTADGAVGASGGTVRVSGKAAASGPVAVDGGAGAAAPGGAGGLAQLASTSPPSRPAAPLSARGGAGTPAGAVGSVVIDGVGKPLVGGVYTP